MTCPQCHFKNRSSANFCVRCGAQVGIGCVRCGHHNPSGSLFCEHCGAALATESAHTTGALALNEKLGRLQRYLPQGLTEKILAHRDKIEGERRHVTVMFCDMAGFTPVVEQLGSESAYDLMDRIYEILIHKVHQYGGTVNEMTGDGIMALFGAPIALEDAPQRAVRSAMAIHREMAELSRSVQPLHETLPALRMRIGIHSGPVVVGTLGNDLRVEFKAVGDTVNLSARMQRLADPGTTLVTEDAFRATEGYFRFESLGAKVVKGIERSVTVYRVITAGRSRTRFDVSAERGLTPFVGRARDLELLLDGFERSKAGRGQACSIIAEAGVGKSRLLYEFRKALSNDNVTFLEGRCLSYSRGVSYHAIVDLLKQGFGIEDGDGDADISGKVAAGLKRAGCGDDLTVAAIFDLFSMPAEMPARTSASPEARKNRITQAFLRLVLKGSQIRPLIMAFEDLHWVDEGSEAILQATLDAVPGARVFLVFTYRPEFVHTWAGRSYHQRINLNRLSSRETLSAAAHLLDGARTDPDLETLILEKTEGIPFYIEELMQLLKQRKIIQKTGDRYRLVEAVGDLPVPSSINDVIMARVDALPDGAKALLQTGSVVGREFGHELIKLVSGVSDEQLWAQLSALKDAELVYERGVYPQSTYVFRHALTRDVAYHSLLQKKRRSVHRRVGEALERLYAERHGEVCELLALHFLNGEDWQRAYRYCLDAGVKNFSHSAYEEAKRYTEDAQRALQHLPRDKRRIEREIDLRFFMRSVLVPLGRHDEWGAWIQGAERLAREIADDARLSNVLNYLSSLRWMHDRPREAIDLGRQALAFARKTKHFSYQTAIMHHLGIFCFTTGDFAGQVRYHQAVRERLTGEAAYSQHGLSAFPGAWARAQLALGLAEMGIFDQIDQLAEEAVRIADEVENALTLAATNCFIGTALLRMGRLPTALEHLEKGHRVCVDANVRFLHPYSAGALADGCLQAGEPAKAISVLREATLPDCLERGVWTVHPLTVLADAYRCLQKDQLAMDTIERALKLARESEERGFESWALATLARIYCEAGRLAEAEKWYRTALDQSAVLAMKPLTAVCFQGLGNVLRRSGRQRDAESAFAKAADLVHSWQKVA